MNFDISFSSENVLKFLFDNLVWFVKEQYGINISGLKNPSNLFNFSKALNNLYKKFGDIETRKKEKERLKNELIQFCNKYKNELPQEFLQQAVQVETSNTEATYRNMFRMILSQCDIFKKAYQVVESMMFIVQWRDVVNAKANYEELINIGQNYVNINRLQERLKILRQRATLLEQHVKNYQLTNDSFYFQKICDLLKETNENYYKPIMRDVEQLRQRIENQGQQLQNRRNNVDAWENLSGLGVLAGLGIAAYNYSTSDTNQRRNNNQTSPGITFGLTLAAASGLSLGLSHTEGTQLNERLNLIKEQLNRLTDIDRQLTEIKKKFREFENAIN